MDFSNEEKSLRIVIFNIVNSVKFSRFGVWLRYSDENWRNKVRLMPYYNLFIELQYVLNEVGLDNIKICFDKGIFNDSVSAMLSVGEYITDQGCDKQPRFADLMRQYAETRNSRVNTQLGVNDTVRNNAIVDADIKNTKKQQISLESVNEGPGVSKKPRLQRTVDIVNVDDERNDQDVLPYINEGPSTSRHRILPTESSSVNYQHRSIVDLQTGSTLPTATHSRQTSTSTITTTLLPSTSSVLQPQTSTLTEGVEQIGTGDGDVRPPGYRFDIDRAQEKYYRKFKLTGKETIFKLKNSPSEINPLTWLELAIRDIDYYLRSHVNRKDDCRLGYTVKSLNFAHGSAGLSIRPIDNFTYQDLWGLISNITQSNDGFVIDNSFIIQSDFINLPAGSGANRKKNLNINKVSKRSIITVRSNDNLCLPRALVVGEAYINKCINDSDEYKKVWDKTRNWRKKTQLEKARQLIENVNIEIPQRGWTLHEIQIFQNYYLHRGIAIVVYDESTFGMDGMCLFDGQDDLVRVNVDCIGTINLLYDPVLHHYDFIKNLTTACGSNYFCVTCNKRYAHLHQHKCETKCSSCYKSPACKTENVTMKKCETCYREFFDEICFENHLKIEKRKIKSLCDMIKICQKCFRLENRWQKKHVCGEFYCNKCKKSHKLNELCYIQKISIDKELDRLKNATSQNNSLQQSMNNKNLYIFYDFETQQDSLYNNNPEIKLHVPNLCVAQQVCTDCLHLDDLSQFCNTCGIHEYIFTDEPVKKLIELCVRDYSYDKKNATFDEIICIAHNARAFDAQFILQELTKKYNRILPSVILNGKNIVSITIGITKFIDSLNYFNMKLSNLPRTFDLPPSDKKGYFPHFFNTRENQEYIGPLPPAEFYSPNTMLQNERDDFYRWYNKTNTPDYVFDFAREIIDYCKMDVTILRRACLAFRNIFINIGNTDPFTEAVTIASACNKLFRKFFLQSNTIAIIPDKGYRRADKHSQKAVEWLVYCERVIGQEIIHAGKNREFRLVEGFIVDGFIPPVSSQDKGTVLEYQGCYYHGCITCFPNNRNKKISYGLTFNEAFENTRTKVQRMRELGYEVREIWECEFDTAKRDNLEISDYINNHPITSKIVLNPRDAFFGGRTENIVASYEANDNQKIMYTDICSLYPWVCKKGKFPVGHPRIYISEEHKDLTGSNINDLTRVEGLIKCKILPPRNLYIPVLPVKMHNRLMFPLCRSCCEEMLQSDCTHERVEDREFTGTWVVDEVRKAIDIGYKVTEIYIIWQYKISQYDSVTRKGGLFSGYIDTFLQIKQQASGWPTSCVDDATKLTYLQEYEKKEGIKLDSNKIEKNSGLRAVAKLCLNSFWGKFAQRNNLKQTDIIKDPKIFFKMLIDPDKEISNIIPINDEVLFVNWQNKDEVEKSSTHTNVVIAAYVTAQARLKLYSYIEKLGRRILYYDTDSCIFVINNNDPKEYRPPIGSLLGDMTNELESYGPDAYIKTFISGGPKFYGCSIIIPSLQNKILENCKVKGFSLNFTNTLKINFDSIKSLIDKYFDQIHYEDDNDDDVEMNNDNNKIELNFNSIRRTSTHNVVTLNETKTCTIVLKKRRFISKHESLPFGYKA